VKTENSLKILLIFSPRLISQSQETEATVNIAIKKERKGTTKKVKKVKTRKETWTEGNNEEETK
jgi:replicative DNA helicase